MLKLGGWLETLGLGQYAQLFAENGVDLDVLPDLTDQDLEKLGVLLGHRRKLLPAIAALDATAQGAQKPRGEPAAQRRQLTVMFADLVGSTALSMRFDPEDLSRIYLAYRDTCARIVDRYDGLLAQFMGDGVMVYFGFPRAHEEDAERAVRAGLDIVATADRLRTPAGGRIGARVGIATGLVVVGDVAAQEQVAVGETPNLAARLQAVAEPGTVVVAASTRRLLGELFRLHPLGGLTIKGVAAPVEAWVVDGESAAESRFEMVRARRLTGFVGREAEFARLEAQYRLACRGAGQVALISGEAGIGKSRFAAQFGEHIAEAPLTRLRYQCSPYHTASAFHPIIEQLKRAAGLDPGDPAARALDKLEAMIAQATPQVGDVAPLFAALLSLPSADRYPPLALSAAQRRRRTMAALLDHLDGIARKNPVLLLFEDVHWADASTLELLDLMMERVPGLPVLVLITYRPEFEPPWAGLAGAVTLSLGRLDPEQVRAMIGQASAGKTLPEEVTAQIVEKTDGVPLFVEELTKAVLESGLLVEEAGHYRLDRPLPPLAIPATLRDSLMARLDRLAPVRLVAQIGAAIGREFHYGLMRAVSRLSDDGLQIALGQLVASELVFQRGTPPDSVYSFKHALVQDAAHGSLLHGSRQQLHAQIAAALATHSPEILDRQPEVLAQHYAEAGLVEQSVAFWSRAGRRSAARSAMAEAAAQSQKALDQLELLPDTPERQRQELELYSSLGAALFAVKGHAAPETGQAYARARKLWEQLGSPSNFLHIPYGQSRYHTFRCEFAVAQRLDEDLLRLSRIRNDSAGRVLGHYSSGRNLMLAGRFAASRAHLEDVLALYDPIAHRSLIHQAGDDPFVNSQAVLGIVLFCLGYPDQALARSDAAIAAARQLAHPPSQAASLANGARLHSLGGDDAALRERAGQLMAVATEQGFANYGADGTIFRGWAEVRNGDATAGLSLLRSGSRADRATGAEAWTPYYTALLAGACEVVGRSEEGLTLLDDALRITARSGVRWFAADLNRLKGQLLLRQGHPENAEELYRIALSVAAEQGAKLFELRAAASLARLHRGQARHSEVRDLLAGVYGWFTEGFDAPDLKAAKGLLDELSSPST